LIYYLIIEFSKNVKFDSTFSKGGKGENVKFDSTFSKGGKGGK
jgi:hypothetical protein